MSHEEKKIENQPPFSCILLNEMGKDAISFLSWAAEPEMEKRKLVTLVATSLQNYLRQVCDLCTFMEIFQSSILRRAACYCFQFWITHSCICCDCEHAIVVYFFSMPRCSPWQHQCAVSSARMAAPGALGLLHAPSFTAAKRRQGPCRAPVVFSFLIFQICQLLNRYIAYWHAVWILTRQTFQ